MHKERDRVSDIIRQEFADRLVFTEEENKRVKNEMSELRARQRVELEKAKSEIEDVKKMKDDEMEEVHKRWGWGCREYSRLCLIVIIWIAIKIIVLKTVICFSSTALHCIHNQWCIMYVLSSYC